MMLQYLATKYLTYGKISSMIIIRGKIMNGLIIFAISSVIGAVWIYIKGSNLTSCGQDCNQGRNCNEKCK
jgi:hypothetical protein